ncbi:uncharacterized protein LOC126682656 [Mercurialis annua]|uniref:uncharacterized protein LOC126661060 n=1 Tax=Mercurialis annua TaxID=3986 RepID=UPI00215FFF14|nr:uncharacterized protein LOC126661060 [Mercurialis annua]XP_050234354.1 uncharacterized protein LOC126682656 [Mercurialis annua]
MSSMFESFKPLEDVNDNMYNLSPKRVRSNCRHGKLALYTSWTKTNPGRIFRRCRQSRTEEDCGAFRWYDEEVSYENIMKLTVLLDKVTGLTDQLEDREKTIKQFEEAQGKATIAFTELLDEYDRLPM